MGLMTEAAAFSVNARSPTTPSSRISPLQSALLATKVANGPAHGKIQHDRPVQAQDRDQLTQILHVLVDRVASRGLVAEPVSTEIHGHEPDVRR